MSKFKTRLHYDWFIYLLVPVLAIPAWIFSFNMLHALKAEEKVSMFFAGDIKSYSIKNDAVNAIDGILGLELASCNPSDSVFGNKFQVVALHNADVVCLPLSVAKQTKCDECFTEINNPKYTYFAQEEKNYGVKIPNKDKLSKYFVFGEEEYALFITATSVYSDTTGNNAYNFIDWLVTYA